MNLHWGKYLGIKKPVAFDMRRNDEFTELFQRSHIWKTQQDSIH